jgi:hypothetical protein
MDGETAKRGQDSPSRLAHGDTRRKIKRHARAAKTNRECLWTWEADHPGAAGSPVERSEAGPAPDKKPDERDGRA